MSWWCSLLCTLWTVWVLLAWLSAWQVRKFLTTASKLKQRSGLKYHPHVTLIVPFKGIDDDITANVSSLCRQEYDDYEIICVLESPDDPAHAPVAAALAQFPQRPSRLMFAGIASSNQGQKTHNQLCVLRTIEPGANGDDVWLFADSDAAPRPQWLREMVLPLGHRDVWGMTTGYRWLFPRAGSAASIWTHIVCVLNSSVTCFLWHKGMVNAWGGSMALRIETARRGNLMARWTGAISDDYAATLMCRELGMGLYFVNAALVPGDADFTRHSFWQFARRQYLITRIYRPWLHRGGLVVTTLWVAGWFSSTIALIACALGAPMDWRFPAAAWIAVFVADQARATLRAHVMRRAFARDVVIKLRRVRRYERFATPLWMTIHWLIILSSCVGHQFTWRGIRYRLRAPNDVQRL